MTKQETIEQMRTYGYVTDEIRNDWKKIANEIGEEIVVDDEWGIAFTTTYIKRHMKMVTPASRRR